MEFEVVNNSGSDLGGSNPTVIKVVGCVVVDLMLLTA